MNRHRGLILVISAPSGGGKTTVIRALLKRVKAMKRSISTTTRPPRGHERRGRDYFFVSQAKFLAMIKQKAFAEWAKVHGQRYGTSRAFLDGMVRKGYDVVLNIDVQGGQSIRRHYPKDSVLVFLRPPSWRELRRRLIRRGDVSPEAMKARLKTAEREMRAAKRYDYVVTNDRVSWAVRRILAILEAERHQTRRML